MSNGSNIGLYPDISKAKEFAIEIVDIDPERIENYDKKCGVVAHAYLASLKNREALERIAHYLPHQHNTEANELHDIARKALNG